MVSEPGFSVSRQAFLQGAALLAAPAVLPAPVGAAAAAVSAPSNSWAPPLERYDADRYGPLLAVSDEGDNAAYIARAAYESAKARAMHGTTAAAVGIMIDGERMVSAGEGPIGPDEYAKVVAASRGKTFCSTNVGVRANARLYVPLPEFAVADAAANESAWLARVFAAFVPFLKTPNGVVRPLTVRFVVTPNDDGAVVSHLVAQLEAGRAQGKLGPASLHRLSLLCITDGPIATGAPIIEIERVLGVAAQAGVPEVAIDGDPTQWAREHLSVATLLNVADVDTLRGLFAAAKTNGVQLVYRYRVDVDSTARTIWTGLYTARAHGLSAGKFGLTPLALEEQERAVSLISGWTKGWTTVPAFYVDTPLVTADDVYADDRTYDGARLWIDRVRALGAQLALFDCPDRFAGKYLIRDAQHPTGVFTIDQVVALDRYARSRGLRPLWSGGLSARLAYELGAHRVTGIFCTGAAARLVAVHGNFDDDPDLARELAPTESGVRRVHAVLQAGFLATSLQSRNASLAAEIQSRAQVLLAAIDAKNHESQALASLDESMLRAWPAYWAGA